MTCARPTARRRAPCSAAREPGAEHHHRARPVLELAALVLHRDDQPAGQVGDAHRRVGRVDVLPARARRAVDVDPRSRSSIITSSSSASASTATVADEVCTRPWLSVTGTRCTRCGPPSNFSRCHASPPRTTNVTWLTPPRSLVSCDSVSVSSRRLPAYARYMSYRSRANRFASSPPSAPGSR